uniref:Bifunctional inhibitor/plant lipid transfer protein/seed storage helical domain-containing protein n=1 Tax=Brassica oleracea TaxID=3712 RepID=A0A3P6C6T7_BRAOL|nr:unnamed protein product [Brassica oleracea]
MASSMKFLCVLGLILLVGTVVDGAGECGRSTPDNEAMKLAPCVGAAQDANAAVPGGCCAQIKRFSQNPKSSGVQPEVALTIPKRCNFANRPVGYKCGGEC